LPPKYQKCCEIPREFDLTALSISLTVTLAISATVVEIFTLKDRKLLILPTPHLFDAPLGGNPLEFLDETYPAKTRVMELPYCDNFITLTSTVFP